MKKLIAIIITVLCITPVFAQESAPASNPAPHMGFQQAGGGKFIYCNNEELIYQKDLADKSNPNPALIMENEHLGKDKYTMFVTHQNNTLELAQGEDPIFAGYDIEVDVRFKTTGPTAKIRLTSVAFEVPKGENASDWGCLDAWATYLQMPIIDQKTGKERLPIEFEPVDITLEPGENVWLSKYITNYCPIPYQKIINIITDFEVTEGSVNADVVAVRSHNTLRDRSNFVENAERGIYYRDRQYKGTADTLPIVNANLAFSVGESTELHKPLPVQVQNQYFPKGNTVTAWHTHINPQEDAYVRETAAESDMLGFDFYDGKKEGYYPSTVPESERDGIWHFDVFHSDTTTGTRNPNYILNTITDNIGIACNLGNYGVRTRYTVTATNNATVGRAFEYYLQTTARNIVTVYDPSGKPMKPFALSKGSTEGKGQTRDKMASVWIGPNTTETFTIEIILPANAPGGMKNSFEWSDEKPADIHFSGKMYKEVVPYQQSPYTNVPMGQFATKLFDSNLNSYDIQKSGNQYIAYWKMHDNILNYTLEAPAKNTVLVFDDSFELVGRHQFEDIVTGIFVVKDTYYVQLSGYFRYRSKDGVKWEPCSDSLYYNGGNCVIRNLDTKTVQASKNGWDFFDVVYQSVEGKLAPNVATISLDRKRYDLGVYDASGNVNYIATSPNGVYRDEKNLDIIHKPVPVAVSAFHPIPDPDNTVIVQFNDKILGFDQPPVVDNGRTLVPIRFLFEQLNADVRWDEASRTTTIQYEGKTIKIKIDSNIVNVDGKQIQIDVPAKQINGRTLIPLRFIMENFGFTVTWDNASSWITVKSAT